MENKYRNMMDEVQAPEGLRESVMNMTERERAKKTRSTPVRVLMAAACICALLVVGAVAAEALIFDFVHVYGSENPQTVYVRMRGDEENEPEEMNVLYEVVGDDAMRNIPLSELSQAIQDFAEQHKEEEWYGENLTFDSWEEAEKYIGRELADNAVLEQAEYFPSSYRYISEDQNVEGNCIVGPFIKYGELSSVDVDAKYSLPYPNAKIGGINNIIMKVEADLYIGYDLPMNPNYVLIDSGHWAVAGQESYLTANGLEAVIIDVKDVQDGEIQSNGSYHAFFFLRGVRFKLEVGYWGDRAEPVLTTLKQVLDAYQ